MFTVSYFCSDLYLTDWLFHTIFMCKQSDGNMNYEMSDRIFNLFMWAVNRTCNLLQATLQLPHM